MKKWYWKECSRCAERRHIFQKLLYILLMLWLHSDCYMLSCLWSLVSHCPTLATHISNFLKTKASWLFTTALSTSSKSKLRKNYVERTKTLKSCSTISSILLIILEQYWNTGHMKICALGNKPVGVVAVQMWMFKHKLSLVATPPPAVPRHTHHPPSNTFLNTSLILTQCIIMMSHKFLL